MKMELLKKITVAACGTKPSMELLAKMEKKPADPVPVLQVYGVATRYKPDSGDKGPYVRFYGQFRAVNMQDKKVYESSVVLLPGIIENGLFAAMGPQDAPREVQFGFTLSVKYDAKAAAKYVYAAESLIPPSENDPLAIMEKTLGTKLALPAPK